MLECHTYDIDDHGPHQGQNHHCRKQPVEQTAAVGQIVRGMFAGQKKIYDLLGNVGYCQLHEIVQDRTKDTEYVDGMISLHIFP